MRADNFLYDEGTDEKKIEIILYNNMHLSPVIENCINLIIYSSYQELIKNSIKTYITHRSSLVSV